MCTLALFFRMYESSPVLLLSNRDEMLDRPWVGPRAHSKEPGIFGPRDSAGGGTWLGVGEAGLVVALTNHVGTLAKGGSFCSRGYVVLEALRHATAREAMKLAASLAPACKHFTLLAADPKEAFVLDHDGQRGSQLYELLPGPHVVTNGRFRDPQDIKARHLKERMVAQCARGLPKRDEVKALMADHGKEAGQQSPICIHKTEDFNFGTVSSAAIAIDDDGKVKNFLFADGPPCTAPYREYAPVF